MMFMNILVIVILCYYINYILKLIFSKKHREQIHQVNEQLDVLHHKTYKTLDEQKEYINLKFPKSNWVWKFSWIMIWFMILQLATFIIIFLTLQYIFNYFNWDIPLWLGLLLLISGPFVINYILKKLNLHT